MRLLHAAFCLLVAMSCSRARPVTNLPLSWKGEDIPRPNIAVSQALATKPVALFVMDSRTAPKEVGFDERNAQAIFSDKDVGVWCADIVRSTFEQGGARIDPSSSTQVTLQLEAFRVVEGGMFNGEARFRVTVVRDGVVTHTDLYDGKSKRWGKTHSPDNMNETLTSALSVALKRLMTDQRFATGLSGPGATTNQPPPLPPRPL